MHVLIRNGAKQSFLEEVVLVFWSHEGVNPIDVNIQKTQIPCKEP